MHTLSTGRAPGALSAMHGASGLCWLQVILSECAVHDSALFVDVRDGCMTLSQPASSPVHAVAVEPAVIAPTPGECVAVVSFVKLLFVEVYVEPPESSLVLDVSSGNVRLWPPTLSSSRALWSSETSAK